MQPKDTGNSYDKIFKENAESIFLPLIALKMGIQISWYKPLKEKMQSTIEREMDLCYEVMTQSGEKFLLNLEFQTRHDPQMIYRMAEYHGMALRKKKLPIKHVVLYLGTKKHSWQTKLDSKEVFTGFELINLHDLDPQELLSSQVPEVVLLAVLTNYPKEQSEALLRLLYERLRVISKTN